MRLAYIVNTRMPSEKAHAYQIVKMCEAFAFLGHSVALFHPLRRQNEEMRGRPDDVFDYYGLPHSFTVATLRNIDMVYFLEPVMPRFLYRPLSVVHAWAWGAYAVMKAHKNATDLYYTRDLPVAALCALRGLPFIYEGHAMPRGMTSFILRRMVAPSRFLRLAVAVTGHIGKEYLDLGFNPSRVCVAPDAVDGDLFSSLPDTAACRKRLGLGKSGIFIGYIGRFTVFGDQEKGIPELIRSLVSIRGDFPHASLLLVGGPPSAMLRYYSLARACGLADNSIRYIPHVPVYEVPYWIRACDVVTVPWTDIPFSAYATSPLKLFEYMAAGTPIVASDLPSLREAVVDGKTAVLVEPGNPLALAKGIVRLLRNPEQAALIAHNAHDVAVSNTWRSRARAIMGACT